MSTARAKGTAWETAVVRYLNAALGTGAPTDPATVRRQVQTGREDQGDIWAYPAVLEAKDTVRHDLPGFIRQANREARNSGAEYGVAVIKKRRASAGDAYVVMDLATFARVLEALRGGPSAP